MSSPSKPKRKRVDLTWAQKRTICEVHKNNPSLTHEEIAKYMVHHHGIQLVSRATVTTILLHSSKWLEVDPQVCEGKIKRQRPAKWPQIEKALLLWVAQIRARREIINDASLVKKAEEFRNAFDISESDLKLSHGWLAKFKKRHWIALHGDSGDGDTGGVAKGGVFKIVALAQKAEYIWMDGQEGQKGIRFNEMRSKTKVIPKPIKAGSLDFPQWSFDGSSTGQAEGKFSDCILNPVFSSPDPIRGGEHVLVLCEVLNPDSSPHETNTRRKFEDILSPDVLAEETLFGFEQEYTMFNKACKVYGWPEGGFPHPQGPFYCGVGLEAVYGRPLVEAHLDACIKAGLKISGINAEVMPGQWEFQIGPAGPLEVGDHVMVARWLLHRLGEDFGITCTFEPKPMDGDWNGAGAHTNYSTKSMREEGGIKAIHAAIEKLSKRHPEHIAQYGLGNERRLTGKHETANISTFKSGVADRGASIRIPLGVSLEGKGYLEDRRPAANVDPYIVARMLIQTTLKN